jgi:Tfp pilus assembly protein PilZ
MTNRYLWDHRYPEDSRGDEGCEGEKALHSEAAQGGGKIPCQKWHGLEGVVRNVSIGGIYIETPSPLEMGEDITLTLDAVDLGKVIDLEGRVVRSEPGRGMGIEFADQENKDVRKLIGTIRKLEQASMLALSRAAMETF